MKKKTGKLDPDESVKAIYRNAVRSLESGVGAELGRQLQAQIEFLERIYRL